MGLLTEQDVRDLCERFRKMLDDRFRISLETTDKLLTASGIVTEKPCYVYAIIATASNAAYSEFAFRNGETVGDTSRLNITKPQYETAVIVFRKPMRFDKGLYVQFVTAGSYCFVQYKDDV